MMCRTNDEFLRLIEPFRRHNMVYASAYVLRNITGLSTPMLYRYLNNNHLFLADVKYKRKNICTQTQKNCLYIRKQLKKDPKTSLQVMANDLGVSRQYVSNLINRYDLRNTTVKYSSSKEVLELV